jgi:hypothetical protein
MKFLTTLFALAILCATASAQTIKALGYDTASGEVVANTGTNVLTFTNEVGFTPAAAEATRSALGAAQTIFTVKTNDQTIIDETNATTITDLTFNTEANARYVVALMPIIANNMRTEFRVVASNAVVYGNWFGLNAFTGPLSTDLTNFFTFNDLDAEAVSEQVFYVESGTNAGSISVEFKSPVADTTNTIKAGSFLRADKMP